MQTSDRARRWLVVVMLSGGVLLLAASPALASHEGTDYDPNDFCHYPDSGVADVEDGPVDEDTGLSGWCMVTVEGAGGGGELPDSGGAGDVGADANGIVPAVRIDAGGGGAAAAGLHPGQLAAALTAGSIAVGAGRARRRR